MASLWKVSFTTPTKSFEEIMMFKTKLRYMRILLLLLSCLTLISSGAQLKADAICENTINEKKTIDEKYQYPILPGNAQWVSLGTTEARINACQLPEEFIRVSTTRALVETVLDYPFLLYFSAYDTIESGFQALLDSFNGLRELANRKDALDELQDVMTELNANDIYYQDDVPTEKLQDGMKHFYAATIAGCIRREKGLMPTAHTDHSLANYSISI